MKQIQIVAAYNIVRKVQDNINMPTDISYAFFRLGELIQPQIDFQVAQQEKLEKKYNCQKDDNGSPHFQSEEDLFNFNKEIDELVNMDIDLEQTKKIPLRIDGRYNLSVTELRILKDFMEFE